ncbi:MAG: hypothetical protein ACTHJT_11980 [Cytophaga sp.]|uniref:hypothetical protein n=1 Tax=Cytophaga sp. TaxID=29535 RepID=UPI003F81455A
MKTSLKKAFAFYKYAALLFTIIYWVYLFIDDWIFIEKYAADMSTIQKLDHLTVWLIYFAVYFLGFTFYFWLITLISIFVYHKLITRKKTI